MFNIKSSLLVIMIFFSSILLAANDTTDNYNQFISYLTSSCCQSNYNTAAVVATYFDLEVLKKYFKEGKIPSNKKIFSSDYKSGIHSNEADKMIRAFISLDKEQRDIFVYGTPKEINAACDTITERKEVYFQRILFLIKQRKAAANRSDKKIIQRRISKTKAEMNAV
jgi:hypothetical protein